MKFREAKKQLSWYTPHGYRGNDYSAQLRAARSWDDLHALLSSATPTPWDLVRVIAEKR